MSSVAKLGYASIFAGAAQFHGLQGAPKRYSVEIAGLLGISRQHLNDIISERKPVSPAVAVRLGKLFGNGPDLWVRMQGAYDTWHAAREVDVAGIPTIREDA